MRLKESNVQVTLTTFLSLDGVMQGPGGPTENPSGGFKQGGWMVPYADEAMGGFVTDWFEAADTFLLGRITYQIMAAYWPQVTDEDDVARKLNSLPKYVVSKTLDKVTWINSTLVEGDPVQEVIKLKGEAGRELQVHGSGNLAQTLIRHCLIDEYRLWFHPLVLGSGKRLFQEGTRRSASGSSKPGRPAPASLSTSFSQQVVRVNKIGRGCCHG
jgi:dihydrofolate reductase